MFVVLTMTCNFWDGKIETYILILMRETIGISYKKNILCYSAWYLERKKR